jgi:DNA polymerase-3 subunit alpha
MAPPDYVKVPPWTDKQRLTEEKLALGFYLSGHLFNSYAGEVRRFIRTKLSELSPSREPRMMAGVIAGVRTQMTQRGKIFIVQLDDGTAVVEVSVPGDLVEEHKSWFKDDEFLAVQGKVSEDRFNGGVRISADKAWDIIAARTHYGRSVSMSLPGSVDVAKLREVLTPYRQPDGLPLNLRYRAVSAECEISLGDHWRVAPADALQMALRDQLGAQQVAIEY